jgi:hypothetical protein
MRLRPGLLVLAVLLMLMLPAPALYADQSAQTTGPQPSPDKPAPGPLAPIQEPAPQAPGGRAGDAAVPAKGPSPQVIKDTQVAQIVSQAKGHTPAPPTSSPTLPARGTVLPPAPVPPGGAAAGRAAWNGSQYVLVGASAPAAASPNLKNAYLGIPAPPSGGAAQPPGAFPSEFFGSVQANTTDTCGFGANEARTARSTDNPNVVVVAAQMYENGDGSCGDSHAWAFTSLDGGQHFTQAVLPALQQPTSGDVNVVYDPKHHVFAYSFLEFNRNGSASRVGVKISSDGLTWGLDTTLASQPNGNLDKDWITVDVNPSSPHYGRLATTWTLFQPTTTDFFDAYSDDGGATWHPASSTINFPSISTCGNGTAPAFDAAGELLVAWWDCDTSSFNLRDELSADGGATWPDPTDFTITNISDIGTTGSCLMNQGGTAFRCNSFPATAGDPNPADQGSHAFVVVWANADSGVTDPRFPGVTATISQGHILSTTNASTSGGTWDGGPGLSFDYLNFNNFGDKFFPSVGFSLNGRLMFGFSDREDNASAGNPHGNSFNEHGTEASSLASLRSNSYITYTIDGVLASPGGSTFIGDYSGIANDDNSFDTDPVWTDVRGGFNGARTEQLCFIDCYTILGPYSPLAISHAGGSTFTDLFRFNTNSTYGGSGFDFWNAVGIREGADGTSVDDDAVLYSDRYFNNAVASSTFSPPINDYLLENDNTGHGPTQPWYPTVHSFSTVGGAYGIEWAAGHIVLGPATSDSLTAASVVRIYDALLNTATTYFVGFRPDPGNSANTSLTLHSASRGNEQGRPNAVADTFGVAPGQPGFVSYATGADPTQFDGVVVVNNNGGAGTYKLYLDSAVPTGTISINSGAAFTNQSNVTLTLAASNPTGGDPVLDMRFSNDNVSFGAWQPFATSTSYTLPAGEGNHTVYVQFRNGAGGVSASASDAIFFVNPDPIVMLASPVRLVDTRTSGGPIQPGADRCFTIGGQGGVPSSALGVVVNLAAVGQPNPGWFTLYPAGQAVPATSTLNFDPHQYAIANGAVVRLGSGGQVCINAGNAAANAILDVTGYLSSTSGSSLTLLPNPARVVDTRNGGGAIIPGSPRCFGIAGVSGIPANAAGVVLNLTSVGYASPGWLTLYPNGQPVPATSTLNFDPNEWAIANNSMIKLGASGQVCVDAGNASSQAIIDIVGYVTPAGLTNIGLVAPARAVDTRTSGGPIIPGGDRCFTLAGTGGVPANAIGVILNLTAVGYGGNGWLTLYPNGQPLPGTSTLNFDVHEWAIANGAVARLGTGGRVCVDAGANASNAIIDITGFLAFP